MNCVGSLIILVLIFGFSCKAQVYPPSNEKITAISGSTVRLEWTFKGNSSLASLLWCFTRRGDSKLEEIATKFRTDDSVIRNSSLPGVGIEPPATLVLKNVDERYNGKYRFNVQLKGGDGEAEVEVYIAAKPNVTFTCLSLNEVNEGDNFTCVCRGEGGNPPANVTWYKDGVQISEIGKENKTLPLINVNETFNGTYKCEARSHTNDSFADEKSIRIIVKQLNKPNITFFNVTPDRVAKEGYNVTIMCISKGVPSPDNTIFRNGTEVSTEKTSTTYTIDFVTPGDAGIYTCIAKNKVGNDSETLNLPVQGPTISTPTTSQPISSITSSNGTVGPTKTSTRTSNGLPDGAIIGIIIGVFVLIIIVAVVVYRCKQKKTQSAIEHSKETGQKMTEFMNNPAYTGQGEDAGEDDTAL